MTVRRRTAGGLALDGPPPVSLGLRRFVLRSVGPPAARFHPLDLDMVTTDGTVARRALCVLPNTGGKSTLLKLLFAVVNPGSTGLIGTGDIAEIVLATDTAHVVLEWQQADGSRYVTGWAAEWERLQKPQTGTKGLRPCWYTFRVGGFGVDDLPFEYDGRRVRWDEYRRQLRALFAEHPGSLGYIADTQVDWRRTLVDRTRIDTELFSYQARMNAAESGAAALVTRLKTPEAVVGFFVEAFDDETRTAATFKEVAAYIDQAASRATMETHAALCGELGDALARYGVQDGEYRAALDMESDDVERRRELAGAVRARATAESARAFNYQLALDAANSLLTSTKQIIDIGEDRRSQYLYIEADLRRRSAELVAAEADEREETTSSQRKAWAKVDAVMAHDAAVAAHHQAGIAFDAAERELAPLRAQVDEAASRLVAALHALASLATAAAAAAAGRVQAAREAMVEHTKRRELEIAARAGAKRDLETGDEQVAAAAQVVADARRDGHIDPAETAADASRRWVAARKAASERRRKAALEKGQAVAAQRSGSDELGAADLARQKALAEADREAARLDTAASSAAKLLGDPYLAVLIGPPVAEVSPHRAVPASVASAAAVTVDGQAESIERSASDTWVALRAVESELGRLAGTDLLDSGQDLSAALAVLREANIGAVTGWSWLSEVVPADDRLAFIAVRPDIVNGVVVNDSSRLEQARTVLDKAGLFPRLAVAVTTSRIATTTADELPEIVDAGAGRFVIEPHPGLYDKTKAEEEIARLLADQAMLTDRHAEQDARGRALRQAAGAARRHAADWPDSRLVAAENAKLAAEAAVLSAEVRHRNASTAIAVAALAEATASAAELEADGEMSIAIAAERHLVLAVAAENTAAEYGAARPSLVEAIASHERAALLAGDSAKEAEGKANLAEEARRQSVSAAEDAMQRAAKVAAPPAGAVPDEPVHIVEAVHASLVKHLEDEAAGRDHHRTLEQAATDMAQKAEPLASVAAGTLGLARRLAGTILAATPDAVRAQQQTAEHAWTEAVTLKARCRQSVDHWQREVRERRPTDRAAHATFADEDQPVDADDAARRAAELSGQLVAARALRDRQQAEVTEAENDMNAATEASAAFSRLVSDHDNPVTGADPYPDDVDPAHRALAELRAAVAAAKEQAVEARIAREKAASGINTRANNRRWADIADSLRERCAIASPDELSDHGERYLAALRTREASLRADLADLDTHRSAVIDSLAQTCEQIRRSLQRVKAASTLPANVFGVGGQQAITIDFKKLSSEATNVALAAVIDGWAFERADIQRDAKTRLTRLMEALSATVERRPEAGRWTVRLLKPRIDGDVTYCTPDRITKEYSGGQELTLAVLLYCTLAAVRADDRTGSDRPPGLLLLDNPFGAASSERLIHMQQELAAAADVQLLCVTALSEPAILNGFNGPGTFRQALRNDRNQRNGHQHVRAIGAGPSTQRAVTAHLAGPPLESGEDSRVSGVGYQTRPPFPAEQPERAADSDENAGTGP